MTHKEIKDKLIKTLLDINVQPFASIQDELGPINETLRESWYVDKAQEIGIKNVEYVGLNGRSGFLAITDNGYIMSGCNMFIGLPFASIFENVIFDDKLNLSTEISDRFWENIYDVALKYWKTYSNEDDQDDAFTYIKAEDFFDKYLDKAALLLGFNSFENLTAELNKGLDMNKINDELRQFITPDFTYDQIYELREGLKSNVDIYQYANKNYTSEQMKQLRSGLESGIDINIYKNPEYNAEQMQELKEGLEKKLNVSIYANKEFYSDEMKKIKEGLEKGIDVSLYANTKFNSNQMFDIYDGLCNGLSKEEVLQYADPKFSSSQMFEIKEGLLRKLDVSLYADPKYTSEQMRIILRGLITGENVEVYRSIEYSAEKMDMLWDALNKGLDTTDLANPKFTEKQMKYLKYKLEMGYDITRYANPNYTIDQMAKIEEGLKIGLDPTIYANPDLTARQMSIILQAMKEGLEASYIAWPGYDENQMEIIYKGLHSKFPVSLYATPSFTAQQMECIYNALDSHLSKEQLEPICMPGFKPDQMEYLISSLKKGQDISLYCSPSIPLDQMKAIATQQYDYKARLFKDFDTNQINEICWGKEKGLDVSIYAYPTFRSDQMSVIREGLQDGIDASRYADLNLNFRQMSIIRSAMKEGYDPTPMLDKRFTADQLRILHRTYRDGGDPSEFANPELNLDEMNLAKAVQKYNIPGLMDFVKEKKYEISVVPFQEKNDIEYNSETYRSSFELLRKMDEQSREVMSSLSASDIRHIKEMTDKFHEHENSAFLLKGKVYWFIKENNDTYRVIENQTETCRKILEECQYGQKEFKLRYIDDLNANVQSIEKTVLEGSNKNKTKLKKKSDVLPKSTKPEKKTSQVKIMR